MYQGKDRVFYGRLPKVIWYGWNDSLMLGLLALWNWGVDLAFG